MPKIRNRRGISTRALSTSTCPLREPNRFVVVILIPTQGYDSDESGFLAREIHEAKPRINRRLLHIAFMSEALQREVLSLYQEHGSALFRYAISVARDAELSRDAVQEAFLRYQSQRSTGGQIAAPRGWLYKVIHNYLMDAVVRNQVPLDHAATCPDPAQRPEAQAEADSLETRLKKIFSPREFDCIRLRADGLNYDEIAAALGISSGTVGGMLSRASHKITMDLRAAYRYPAACSSNNSA
jgi:RNA polymerase sigma-70 factor, ECF subfamily